MLTNTSLASAYYFFSSVIFNKVKQLMVANQLFVVKHLGLPLVWHLRHFKVWRLLILMQQRNGLLMQMQGTFQVHLVSFMPRRKLMVNDGRISQYLCGIDQLNCQVPFLCCMSCHLKLLSGKSTKHQ